MKKFALLMCLIVLITGLFVPSALVYAEENEWVNNTTKDIYELDTGIINYASVTAFIDNGQELDAIKTALTDGKTPAMVYLRVKFMQNKLQVVGSDGAVLTTLTDVLNNYTRNKIIPAFYIESGDTETAQAIQQYIMKHSLDDSFVVSKDVELLRSVIICKNSLGNDTKLETGGMLVLDNADTLSIAEMNSLAKRAKARAVMVDASAFPKERIHEMARNHINGTCLSVYLKTEGANQMQTAVLNGAFGICADDWKGAIDYIESFKRNVYVRPINIIAHRGMDVVYQENTIEGVIQAALANVAIIEVDPRLTKDKNIVLMHDPDIHRVTGLDGLVGDYTLAQLKSISVNVNANADAAPVCSLEDVFIAYQKYGLTTPLTLDAKETNIEYYEVLYDLIEKYDMWDCIGGIGVANSEHSGYVKEMFGSKKPELYDKISGTTVDIKGNWALTIENWLTVLSTNLSATYGGVSPYYTKFVYSDGDGVNQPEVLRDAKDRAIAVTPYQFDEVSYIEEAFFYPIADFSTGWADYFKDFMEYLVMDKTEYSASVGEEIVLSGKTVTINKQEQKINCLSYMVIDGDADVIKTEDGKLVANKNGSVTVRTRATFVKGNIEYDVYSDPLTITVGVDTSNPTINEGPVNKVPLVQNTNKLGTADVVIVVSFVVVAVALSTCLILIVVNKGKKHG